MLSTLLTEYQIVPLGYLLAVIDPSVSAQPSPTLSAGVVGALRALVAALE